VCAFKLAFYYFFVCSLLLLWASSLQGIAVTADAIPFVIDVKSMFTSMPQSKTVECMAKVWTKLKQTAFPDHPLTVAEFERIVRFVLENCYFTFNGATYKQIAGSPMGSNMSVVAANCFMSVMLDEFLSARPQWSERIPLLGRSLDDILGFWLGSEELYDTFIEDLNRWSQATGWMVTLERPTLLVDGVSVNSHFGAPLTFLDVELYWKDNWHTKVYSKPTDVHAYLPYDSAHARHVVKNIPSIVATRLRKLCSEDAEYVIAARRFKGFLLRAGYPAPLLNRRFGFIGHLNRKDLLRKKLKLVPRRVVCTFPTHPALPNASGIITNLHPILAGNRETSLLFPGPQMLASRKGRTVRQLVCNPSLERSVPLAKGCFLCPSALCSLHPFLVPGRTITSSKNGLTFPVGAHVSCQSVDVIYVITCTKCNKQGVGECVQPVPRMQQYIRRISQRDDSDWEDSHGDVKIVQHFFESPHTIGDLSIMFVDAVPGLKGMWNAVRNPVRRRWELVWMDRLESELNKIKDWRHSFPGGQDNRGGMSKGKAKGRGKGKERRLPSP